jgi:hypothetical protein
MPLNVGRYQSARRKRVTASGRGEGSDDAGLLAAARSDVRPPTALAFFARSQRFYKAYVADRLDGLWRPLAGWKNVGPAPGVEAWTDNVGHGELIRDGNDQTLTVVPENLRFVFQGPLETDKKGEGYGRFPWRIGVMTPVRK